MTAIAIILVSIFAFLSLCHVNWVFGGKWGAQSAIPTKPDGEMNFKPGPIPTLIVAVLLSGFAFLTGAVGGLFSVELPDWLNYYFFIIISGLFLLRAIGEFNYVGFFKKVRGTKFSKADDLLFSPLCLLISVLAGILYFF